jgi:predicted RNA-binding Zn ribbon-like protein
MELLTYADQAVELVNTAERGTGRPDRLATDQDVLELLPAEWQVTAAAARRGLEELRDARPRLRRVFDEAASGHGTRAIQVLNRLLGDFPAALSISDHTAGDHTTSGWHLHLLDRDAGPARRYVTGAAVGLAYTIAERGLNRLGICCATPCRSVFVDTTTNGSRRYCSERCATRANVAAHRARKRGADG